jgi:hypothetical protein
MSCANVHPVRPSSATARRIVVVCAALLLLAQVSGLHYHRHVEPASGQSHGTELHFEDGGLHLDETRADHRHGVASHRHVDVESQAVKTGLVKAFFDSLLLPLLTVVVVLATASAAAAAPRPSRNPEGHPPRPFDLRPPSQAPPPVLVPA